MGSLEGRNALDGFIFNFFEIAPPVRIVHRYSQEL